jgi:hypothetical protein
VGQLGQSGASSDGKDGETFVDTQSSNVVARAGGATRAKRSIFGWERWGDIRSGPLNEHLIMY